MESESSMSFQKIVLIVAIIALILMLSVIGYMMYYSSQNQPFPPIGAAPRCPDKWREEGLYCKNDVDTASNMFTNVGSFLTDTQCVISGNSGSPNACTDIAGLYDKICKSPWVQGNVTNGKDPLNCYLLASQGTKVINGYGTATLVINAGGSGYNTHIYKNVQLTGSGASIFTTYPRADITIMYGRVHDVILVPNSWVSLGTSSTSGNGNETLTAVNTSLGGIGSGFLVSYTATGYTALLTSGGTTPPQQNAALARSGSITSGSGYNRKVYLNVPLTLVSGTAAATYPNADITVDDGVVSIITENSSGKYVDTTTILKANDVNIGSGSGFTARIAGLTGHDTVDKHITSPLSYTKETLEKDVDWAKKYGITWDGYN